MIYALDKKETLRQLEEYSPPATALAHRVMGVLVYVLGWMLFVVLAVIGFVVVAVLSLLARISGSNEPDDDEEQIKEEGPFPQADVEHDERTAWLNLRMNHEAFEEFVTYLEGIYGHKDGPAPMVVEVSGRVGTHDDGYHAHLEDVLLWLPSAVIVYTGKGLVKVTEGWILSASPGVWKSVLIEWRNVLDRRQPVMIVLDREQPRWCDRESAGRFSIEYIPDLTVDRQQKEPSGIWFGLLARTIDFLNRSLRILSGHDRH